MKVDPYIETTYWALKDIEGKTVEYNSTHKTFKGRYVRITGGRPPQHAASTGRIYGHYCDEPSCTVEFFPGVCDLKWHERDIPF